MSKELFTLIATDPDAPSRSNPMYREFVHWVVVNIPGNDLRSGVEIAPYVGPAPPHGTDSHRYAFFLYKQPKVFDIAAVERFKAEFEVRCPIKTAPWAKAQGLGLPVGYFMFQSHWTAAVDGIHASMGFLPPEEYQSRKYPAIPRSFSLLHCL